MTRNLTICGLLAGFWALSGSIGFAGEAGKPTPRTYDRKIELHHVSLPDLPATDEDTPTADKPDRLKRKGPDLQNWTPPPAPGFQEPIPIIPPEEPEKKKNWILPPLSEDLKATYGKEARKDLKSWGWLSDDVQNQRDKQDEEAQAEAEQDERDAAAEDRLKPSNSRDENEGGLLPENRFVPASPMAPVENFLISEPIVDAGSESAPSEGEHSTPSSMVSVPSESSSGKPLNSPERTQTPWGNKSLWSRKDLPFSEGNAWKSPAFHSVLPESPRASPQQAAARPVVVKPSLPSGPPRSSLLEALPSSSLGRSYKPTAPPASIPGGGWRAPVQSPLPGARAGVGIKSYTPSLPAPKARKPLDSNFRSLEPLKPSEAFKSIRGEW